MTASTAATLSPALPETDLLSGARFEEFKPVAPRIFGVEAASAGERIVVGDFNAVRNQILAELVEFCRAGLPSFKRPRAVVFTEGFPTTATGKVRRVELRAMAAEVLNPAAITEAGAPGEAP